VDPETLVCSVSLEEKLHSRPRCAQTDQARTTTPVKEEGPPDDRPRAGPGDHREQHLQPRRDSPTPEEHTFVGLAKKLPTNLSSRARQECARDLHPVDSAAAERAERQRELEASRRTIRRRIQSREEGVRVLQLEAESLAGSADRAVDDSEEIFAGLIGAIERRRREATSQIRSRQKTEVSRVAELRDELEEEIADLRRTDAELLRLSRAADGKPSLARLADPPNSYTRPLPYVEDVTAAVSAVSDKLHRVLQEEWPKASEALSLSPDPTTRAELLRYSRDLTLDPNTVHTHVLLSEGNRKATLVKKTQLYHRHPDRFVERWQVLSKEGLTGRCYWEVRRSGVEVFIAVAYKDISRSGAFDACVFGNNGRSWGLASYKNGYQFKHGNVRTPVSGPRSSVVGVYLDHGAGVLSFYSVSDTMTLLHRVQTTFTQPLYAGFWLPSTKGDTVELCTTLQNHG